jgi:hypothetical protein
MQIGLEGGAGGFDEYGDNGEENEYGDEFGEG